MIRVVLLQDDTVSRVSTGTPRLRTDDVGQLFDTFAKRGNAELTVGLISDRSGLDFQRIGIADRPTAPLEPALERMNPFDKPAARDRYQSQLADYREHLAEWEQATQTGRTDFLKRIAPLLYGTRTAPSTDAAGALNASARIFNEDRAFGRQTSRYLVVLSDLDDTVGNTFLGLPPDVTIVVVNKAGHLGLLESAHPPVLFDFLPIIQLASTWR